MTAHCPHCACNADAPAHRLLQALHEDDLNTALELGLLDAQCCPGCTSACHARLLAARDTRRAALAARNRYRMRNARLARIKNEREAARRPAPAPAVSSTPALPSAASDALARALAKAKARHT